MKPNAMDLSLYRGDWVKIRGTSQLVRRGGGTTEVEALNCIKDDLKGRCRGLKKVSLIQRSFTCVANS